MNFLSTTGLARKPTGRMKTTILSTLSSLILAAGLLNSQAWVKVGNVYCDANTNGVIDSGDAPVQSVLVVVTNVSGTFSNASWTTAEGLFVIGLPDQPDHFVVYVNPATPPSVTTAVLPGSISSATNTKSTVNTNNFLIKNPACAAVKNSGNCWLTGGGTNKSGRIGRAHV